MSSRGKGENESRNSSRGGPKVTNLRATTKRECERRVVLESGRAITAGFCSARVITRTPRCNVFLREFFGRNKPRAAGELAEETPVNFRLNRARINIEYELKSM